MEMSRMQMRFAGANGHLPSSRAKAIEEANLDGLIWMGTPLIVEREQRTAEISTANSTI